MKAEMSNQKLIRRNPNISPIKEFQQANGLVDDEIIGVKTIAKMQEVWKIHSKMWLAHFLGQLHHESGGFNMRFENLNYSAQGLTKTFRKYFPTIESTTGYARNPMRIANRVYANRMGNGDELSGDGWKYRGRGAIQLTGKNNYNQFNPRTVNDPDSVAYEYYFSSAKFFFDINGIWGLCEDLSEACIKRVTRRINGGYNGLEDRIKWTKYYYSKL